MNKNRLYAREEKFGSIPKIHVQRSIFDESHSHKTTFENGRIIPIYVDPDVMAGDTVEMDVAEVIRMSTPIFPVMDNAFADIMFFSVPIRLLWDHWEEFWGYNKSEWTQQLEYQIPQIEAPENGWAEKTLADYMGIPTKVDGISISALPARAYTKIVNDWFRDQNLQKESHMYTDDTTRTGVNTGNRVTDLELYGKPAKASKIAGFFTSALPSPQKGPTVKIPLGETAAVKDRNKFIDFCLHDPSQTYDDANDIRLYNKVALEGTNGSDVAMYNAGAATTGDIPQGWRLGINTADFYADLSNATAASISALRQAFQLQRFYEAQARGGTRYIEFIRNIFGVESSDARLQRSEFLGGVRFQINMDQILQTSSTDATSPQGNAAGFSVTARSDSMFTKSFEEHSILIGICVCRTERTYQQGIPKGFLRKKFTDFYNPYFAHLSEQPIMLNQIYAQGTDDDDTVFGYQEAWAEYRYKESRVSASMRSNASGSLDAYHYADDYESKPTLSSEWIEEPKDNVARTLAVVDTEDQYIADFYFKVRYVRPMPVYGVPGLIDHV